MPGFKAAGGLPGVNSKAEFHRVHRWVIEDLGFPIDIAHMASNPIEFRMYAQSITLPELQFETKPGPGASLDYPIAVKAVFDAVTIKMYDIYGLHKVFEKWQDKIWNQKDGIQAINEYAGRTKFQLIGGDGALMRRYTLSNAFPKHISHGELTYTSSDIKLLTITYAFSHMNIDHIDHIDHVDDPPPSMVQQVNQSMDNMDNEEPIGPVVFQFTSV
ncbi:MAG: hypothetical protein JRI22_20190 [Deltaproteobacteria bacterium]|nr:hypothetical protein [Deltaproteobacteria bacterium]